MASADASQPSELDRLATRAQSGGRNDQDALIEAFLAAVIVVPLASDPTTGPFEPVMTDIDGVPHMLVCDSLAATHEVQDLARFATSMRGLDVVRGLQPGYAILVRTPSTRFALDEALLGEARARHA
jgi:hypothetical protein